MYKNINFIILYYFIHFNKFSFVKNGRWKY